MKIPFFKKMPSLRRQGSREVAQGGAPRAPGLAGGGPGRLAGINDAREEARSAMNAAPEPEIHQGPEGFEGVYQQMGSDTSSGFDKRGRLAENIKKKLGK